MKYVAFLDILGFKEKLKTLNQAEAQRYIGDFSSTIYNIWRRNNPQTTLGYIVSDSLIIYSDGCPPNALRELITMVRDICREEFRLHSILIRGAIAKGEFDKLEARELWSLGKSLGIGQAYVDAYLLESAVKTVGIALSDAVYEDYQNAELPIDDVLEETIKGDKRNIYRYLDADYLLEKDNLMLFISLANKSRWLPHYYNALYSAIAKEKSDKKIKQMFCNLIELISGENYTENWRMVDLFIKNTFSDDVFSQYQKRFSKFLRESLQGFCNLEIQK